MRDIRMSIEEAGDSRERVRVSIVTVVRNGREFIKDAITSVLDQTYPDLEYIVVDGASTDGTCEIIKSFSGQIAKWISEPDHGIADAFNKGLALSTGDYVLFLNSDDRLASPRAIEKMVQAIVRERLPELIYGDYVILDRTSDMAEYHGSVHFRRRDFLRGRVLPHPCLLTHRSYFQRFGSFDTTFRIAMDYEWMLRGALQCRVVHVPYEMTHIRNGGISVNNPRTVDEIVLALRRTGHVRTCSGALLLRAYFWSRSLVRKIFTVVGMYPLR
jgi:glycosyltransferase